MKKRLKLVYVPLRFSPEFGGPFYNLFFELSKYIDVVCVSAGFEHGIKKTEDEVLNPHFRIRRFSYNSFPLKKDILIPTNLKKILDEEKPDIVQSDEFYRVTSLQAGKWCIKNKIPFVLSSRMRYRSGFFRNFMIWIFKILSRDVVGYSSKVIATQGACSRDEFLRWFPKKKKDILMASTGLDVELFTKSKGAYDFKKKFGIPRNKKIILNVARIYPVKRLDLSLKVFALVKKKFPDCVFVNVGSAEEKERKKLDNVMQKYNLKIGQDVFFVGGIENKKLGPAYNAADVFINTSETEGICFSFLEAMAFKLPIVAFDVGGNSGVVENGKNGYLKKFGDVNGVSESILEILENDKFRETLGNEGYKRLNKEFDIKKNVKKLLGVYGR